MKNSFILFASSIEAISVLLLHNSLDNWPRTTAFISFRQKTWPESDKCVFALIWRGVYWIFNSVVLNGFSPLQFVAIFDPYEDSFTDSVQCSTQLDSGWRSLCLFVSISSHRPRAVYQVYLFRLPLFFPPIVDASQPHIRVSYGCLQLLVDFKSLESQWWYDLFHESRRD